MWVPQWNTGNNYQWELETEGTKGEVMHDLLLADHIKLNVWVTLKEEAMCEWLCGEATHLMANFMGNCRNGMDNGKFAASVSAPSSFSFSYT